MTKRLGPGERLCWTSRCGTYSVVLQRTDAGQTWTVETRHNGMTMDDLFVTDSEYQAHEVARTAAETLRDLAAMEVAL
jgi:hypothetical protein